MKQWLTHTIAILCLLLVSLLSQAASAEEQAPKDPPRHFLQAHVAWAPIYGGLVVIHDYDITGLAPGNIAVRADYEVRVGSIHLGVGALYRYVPHLAMRDIEIPLIIKLFEEDIGNGSTLGLTLGPGYYVGIGPDWVPECDCIKGTAPSHGFRMEVLFSYTKMISDGLDFSFRAGVSVGIHGFGQGPIGAYYAFPIELGLRRSF